MSDHRSPSYRRLVAGALSAAACAGCLYQASAAPSRAAALAIWIGAAAALSVFVWTGTLPRRGFRSPSFGEVLAGRLGEAVILVLAGYSNDWVVKLGGVPLGWLAALLVGLAGFTRLFRAGAWPAEEMARFQLTWSGALLAAILGAAVESQVRAEGVVAERAMQAGLTLVGAIALASVMRDARRRSGE